MGFPKCEALKYGKKMSRVFLRLYNSLRTTFFESAEHNHKISQERTSTVCFHQAVERFRKHASCQKQPHVFEISLSPEDCLWNETDTGKFLEVFYDYIYRLRHALSNISLYV